MAEIQHKIKKEISNSFSTGGMGDYFENAVQSTFVLLLLVGGVFPELSPHSITKIEFQSRYRGINTDDITVYAKNEKSKLQNKMFGQIKHHLNFIKSDENFQETINAAWLDFKSENFNKDKDIIALITGLLSKTDTINVRNLLLQAKSATDVNDFELRLKTKNFASKAQLDKLDVFKNCLKKANNNNDVSIIELWEFLKVFNLFIYDVDIKGICLSLLHTIIEQYDCSCANSVWCEIKDFTKQQNINASFITLEKIPDNIRTQFSEKKQLIIPENFITKTLQGIKFDDVKYIRDLAKLNLIGSWNENSEQDVQIVSEIIGSDYEEWIEHLREVLLLENSPISLKNGIWDISNREYLLSITKSFIFDKDLKLLKNGIVRVLKTTDPALELEKEKRYMANIYGKTPPYSAALRKGLAETLALIGCNSEIFDKTSINKVEETIILTIREIFDNADWILWASLCDVLPLLAEASPKEFISALNQAINSPQNLFIDLFAQEGVGISGRCYMTGVLWALETIAWNPNCLTDITLILGELSNIDPGGQWGNRPINSLITIFMPWHTQTTASIDEQFVAIKSLLKENIEIAWQLLIELLPQYHQSVGETAKPLYAKYIPEKWKIDKKRKSYNKKISFYVSLLIEQTKNNIEKMILIVKHLDILSNNDLNKIIKYMSTPKIINYNEEKRKLLWSEIRKLTDHHKKYHYTEWAMDITRIYKLEKLAEELQPKNLINLYAPLFDSSAVYNYDDENEKDYEKAEKNLNILRKEAIIKIFEQNPSFEQLIKLIDCVKTSSILGGTLASIDEYIFDTEIFPGLLTSSKKSIQDFMSEYIYKKFWLKTINWLETLNVHSWNDEEIVLFFKMLPFSDIVWNELEQYSKNIQNKYWKEVNVNPYIQNTNLDQAIKYLILHHRYIEIVNCLNKQLSDGEKIDNSLIIDVLQKIDPTSTDINRLDSYHVCNLIKLLQQNKKVDKNDLLQIEWKYYRIFENYAKPITIENKIRTSPEFFCELISFSYNSTNEDYNENKLKLNKNLIEQAWDILHELRPLAGINKNGKFNHRFFISWFNKVIDIAKKTGYLDIALTLIGHILFYSPADEDGFWINKEVAEILNKKNYDSLRNGYYSEIINSRGCHWVDPTAKPEKELAKKYRNKAQECRNETFNRLASTLEDAAKNYEREAERILQEQNTVE